MIKKLNLGKPKFSHFDKGLKFGALLAVVVIILSRHLGFFTEPRLWAEEGTVYFSSALHSNWFVSLFQSHLGYLSLSPNIATTVAANWAPLEKVPLVTTLFAFTIQLIPVAIILWSHSSFWNRRIIKLFGILIILFAAPSEEIWLNTINSQVYFLLITFLILLENESVSTFKKWIYRILLVFAGLTGAISAFLVPMFIYNAWYEKKAEYFIRAGLVILCALVQIVIFSMSWVNNTSTARFAIDIPVFISILWTRSIALTFLGVRNAQVLAGVIDAIHTLSTQLFLVLNLFLAVALSILFWFLSAKLVLHQKILLLGSYFTVFFLTLMASLFVDKYPLIILGEATRYFYVPNVILMFIVLANIKFERSWLNPSVSKVAIFLLIAGLWWGMYRYWSMADMFAHKDWVNWNTEITEWRQQSHKRAIEIWPSGWGIWLGEQVYYPMTDGLALTGIDTEVNGDGVNISLQWQGGKVAGNVSDNLSYTAFVHLVNHNGVMISGYDNLLEDMFPQPSELLSSYHPMPDSVDLNSGKYDLVVGIYYFQDNEVINVKSIELADAIAITK